jgi:hypothetical protein
LSGNPLHAGEKAHLGAALGKIEDIPVLQVYFLLLDHLAVDDGAIGTVIYQFEAIPFSDDSGVLSRYDRQFNGETHVTGGVATDYDLRFRELLNLPLQRSLHVYQLDDDYWWTFHEQPVKESGVRVKNPRGRAVLITRVMEMVHKARRKRPEGLFSGIALSTLS